MSFTKEVREYKNKFSVSIPIEVAKMLDLESGDLIEVEIKKIKKHVAVNEEE